MDSKQVFVLNGLPGTGKTLLGKIVGVELEAFGIDFLHLSSIDVVKDILRPESLHSTILNPDPAIYAILRDLKKTITNDDWDGEKNPYWRGVMSELKRKVVEWNPTFIDTWIMRMAHDLKSPGVLFVDIREPENIMQFVDYNRRLEGNKVSTVLLRSNSHQDFNNSSDARVMQYPYDIILDNPRSYNRGDDLINMEILATSFVRWNVLPSIPSRFEKLG